MPSSATTTQPNPLRVIVIGAGISGLACARELQQRKYQVLVVEGSSRVGGRLKGEAIECSSSSSTTRQTGVVDSTTTHATQQHCVDVGGALIHGIDDNPIYKLCSDMGVKTHLVNDCILMDANGTTVDEQLDKDISDLFNDCLEETFQRIQNSSSDNKTHDESFGTLLNTVVAERRQKKSSSSSSSSFDPLLFQWHQSNLELSCGASFQRLGYTWNDDEPYEFVGEHHAVEPSWRAVVETLSEGLNIVYNAQVQRIEYYRQEEVEQTKKARTARRSTPARETSTGTTSPSARAATPTSFSEAASRVSRRLRGKEAGVRRSKRSTKGAPAAKLSIADASSLSYDAPVYFERQLLQQDKEEEGTKRRRRDRHAPTGTSTGTRHQRSSPKVRVTVRRPNGLTTALEADVVVCTLPLGILKIPVKQAGHVTFDPPLPPLKQQAIKKLGCGLLNKCVLSFPHMFWEQDTEFMGMASDPPHLILNSSLVTGKPILVFMFGGDYARKIEYKTDAEIVGMCMDVLRKACRATVPDPIDYVVTRWGHEYFARGAFVYIPPGVEGMQQLEAMSEPIVARDGQPLVQFAGEHTTPYHPSTIHGAFLSGIREAYRLDLCMEPDLNDGLEFEFEVTYERTFPVRRRYKREPAAKPSVAVATRPTASRGRRHGVMSLRNIKPKPRAQTKETVPAASFQHPDATRRSQRRIEQQVGDGSNGSSKAPKLRMEDRTLLRSYDSYRSWPLILSKVFPGQDSVAELQTSHQELLDLQAKKAIPDPSSLASWIASAHSGKVPVNHSRRNGEHDVESAHRSGKG
jgi:monoamine oxidase